MVHTWGFNFLGVQVEHPVTEWIAQFNLPAAQLGICMGIPLWRMPGKLFSAFK